MEGPAVKWFGMACWISQSMLRFAPRGREGRAIPEDAGARLTMERLRRRIRLICAGCSEEPSRMTPLRRELPLSRGASRPDPNTGRRIADVRTLQSCSHRAAALGLARGILARHESQVRHECAGPPEPLEVHDLGQENDRRQRVDPAEATEPADGLAIRRGARDRFELLVEFRLPRQCLLEREHRSLERALQRGQVEPLLADPPPVPLAPVLAAEVGTAMAGEELEH